MNHVNISTTRTDAPQLTVPECTTEWDAITAGFAETERFILTAQGYELQRFDGGRWKTVPFIVNPKK